MIKDPAIWSLGLGTLGTVITVYHKWQRKQVQTVADDLQKHEERCEEDKRIRRAESREDFGEVHKKIDRIIDKLLSKLDELK